MIPEYKVVNIRDYEPICGMYTIGFIKHHYPLIHIIDVCAWEQNETHYKWLAIAIDNALSEGKIVFVMLYDEDIIFPINNALSLVLNSYINDNVYFITQLDDDYIYTNEHNIQCKILELPWMPLNDCLCYDALHITYDSSAQNSKNYMSFIGRPSPHKIDLIASLQQNNLSHLGLSTVSTDKDYRNLPKLLQDSCTVNKYQPYTDKKCTLYPKERGCYVVDDILISGNVKNFIQLQKYYNDIPLTIHTETTLGIFFSTEKSVWPVLLGKLFLIYGRPGTMSWIQRFYNIDMSEYINLHFDTLPAWNDTEQKIKLEHLITDNKEFIINAKEIHTSISDNLISARYKFGENLYNFFNSQIDKIYNT